MIFGAPWMLWGLAGLALPIVIHLLDRSRSSPQDWPCLRFLKIAHEHSAQRTRIKHLLVLLARCLLLALIILAMAQPYLQRESFAQSSDLPTTLVIVLDNSFSMACRDGAEDGGKDQTRFERAKRIALEQIENLALNDEVALVLASDQPVMLTEKPTRDLEKVRELIENAPLSNRPTNLSASLVAAFAVGQLDAAEGDENETEDKVLQKRRRAWRHVLLLTDMQRGGWEPVIRSNVMQQVTDPLPLTVVAVGHPRTANRFVRRAEVRGDAGGTLDVEVEVAIDRRGGEPPATATLWIDGDPAGSPETVPASARKIRLIAPLPSPGVHHCMVRLEGDALPLDNTFYFPVNIGGAGRVTVVDGDPSHVDRLSASFFLRAALATIAGRGGGMPIERITPEQLSETGPAGDGCLVLVNVGQLDGAALANVENYLRTGGNVFVTLGDQVDIEHYNRDWKFLPLQLDGPLGGHEHSRAYGVLIETPTHPIIAGDLDLTATRFFQFIGANPLTLRSGGITIATFSNGSPALAEASFGAGKVLLMTGSLDANWSNLPYRRAFVPLIDRIVGHFTRRQSTLRSVKVHEPVRLAGPRTMRDQPVTITAPDKRTQTLNAKLDPATEQAVVQYRDTHAVGVYTVQTNSDYAMDPSFAVNVDTRESILTTVDPEKLKKAFGDHPVRFVQTQADEVTHWEATTDDDLGRDRTELWSWLLLAALAVFALETLLANFFTRRQEAPAVATTQYVGRTEKTMARRAG